MNASPPTIAPAQPGGAQRAVDRQLRRGRAGQQLAGGVGVLELARVEPARAARRRGRAAARRAPAARRTRSARGGPIRAALWLLTAGRRQSVSGLTAGCRQGVSVRRTGGRPYWEPWISCSSPRKRRRDAPALDGPLARADAAAHARRLRRPGAPARRGLGAADRDRVRAAALDGPVRTARHGQDDARADDRRARGRRVRGAVRRQRRPARGARGDRAGARAATRRPRRRSSSSTRSTASTRRSRTRCCPPSRRGSSRSSARRPRTRTSRSTRRCSAARRCTSCTRSAPPTSRRWSAARSTAANAATSAVDDDAVAFLAARSGGDARAALNALELACETAARTRRGARDGRRRRGRDAAQGGAATTRTATSTSTSSRPGSSRRAARTPTRRSTTSRRCSRAARTRATSPGG